jgi:8-oxo-dGTP diphosphatase
MATGDIDLTVDAVVFGYNSDKKIMVLLVKRKYNPFKNTWAIPGGFVLPEESLEEAVLRELQEETGVSLSYMEQLYTFGKPNRDPRKRIVSVAYFGLVRPGVFTLKADSDAEDAEWFDIKNLPELAFDHHQILDMAVKRIRAKIVYQPIGFDLLDKKFPFSDLENLYMTLLDRDIDRRNFRKKFLSLNVLNELDEKVLLGQGRPAKLFEFDEKRYNQLTKEGIIFEI